MQKFKLIFFTLIFLSLLIPTLVSSPLAYSFLMTDWDNQEVISNISEICETGDYSCIDTQLRLDIATPIFAFLSLIFFCIIGIILIIYSIFYFWWIRKKYYMLNTKS